MSKTSKRRPTDKEAFDKSFDKVFAVQTKQEPKYRDCERCDGLGTVMENTDHPIEKECPDCEGEGKVDQRGFAKSYSADSRLAIDNTSAAAYACPTCGQTTTAEQE